MNPTARQAYALLPLTLTVTLAACGGDPPAAGTRSERVFTYRPVQRRGSINITLRVKGDQLQVVKGNGPMNRERMGHKRRAWDDGAWVREAAAAHAAKQHHEEVA